MAGAHLVVDDETREGTGAPVPRFRGPGLRPDLERRLFLYSGILGVAFPPPVFAAVAAAALLHAHVRCEKGKAGAQRLFAGVSSVAGAIVGVRLARLLLGHVADPPEWDFLAFWMWGRILAEGGSPYALPDLLNVALPYAPGAEFLREVIQTGCPYPPPTLPLLLPLGYADPEAPVILLAWKIGMFRTSPICVTLLRAAILTETSLPGM